MSDREDLDLYREVMSLLDGHDGAKVIQALVTSLTAAIGCTAPDLQIAEAYIDTLPADIKRCLRHDLDSYSLHREKWGLAPLR